MSVLPRASVPCGSCTACCRGELIVLHPEAGDKVETYETVDIIHPLNGKPAKALKMVDGACVYLGESGCTIHDRAPTICQEFDCRKFVKMIGSRADRRRRARKSEVVRAGIERMSTLP